MMKVLELGCGNSQLCDEMYKDGITDITCIDLSAVAVEKMQQRISAKGYKEIKVLEADMLHLPFSEGVLMLLLRKEPCGDPWNPRPANVTQVKAMLDGVHRVLKPDGIFISISFGQPHFRRPLFDAQEYTWSIEWNTFGDGFHYFFYILRKGKRSLDDKASCEKKIECSFKQHQISSDYLGSNFANNCLSSLVVLSGSFRDVPLPSANQLFEFINFAQIFQIE
ncbi:hypothetical protein GH714_011334 [Hevea brasiliensis]|uniref:Methyltransferase domain-containing protein n=1 Tax=Hevea brasiliensis TaxID=3981 RepID=A0A6A6L2S3_HEVBR|nr:hypothetical protein GH714_011334 [Hevea brasiliensis]